MIHLVQGPYLAISWVWAHDAQNAVKAKGMPCKLFSLYSQKKV